jgi:hypothetical protein
MGNPLEPSVNKILPPTLTFTDFALCTDEFCMILGVNSDYFLKLR